MERFNAFAFFPPDTPVMIGAIFILMLFELFGEILRSALHIAVPGPVIGMLLLAAVLVWRYRREAPLNPEAPPALDKTAGVLLQHLGLLFVPAGVGIIAEASLLRQEWMPILVGVVGSTVLSLAATGLVMHHFVRNTTSTVPQEGVTP
ncbi:MAG: CidA/LrgA family protein [Acidocella sp.]|uniref:CidA/LrgA family protein n=1 Tax=Acidocella sp. TaxID=50710 RepID=UPI003FC1EFC5